ncbi:LysR family transcriptional regulator [Budviciaceae bacterium BWR-B9]|uniref:LysR family transcriptional regulator n=1 Tax=Limnobaculum allomyrinae TaxID=2791986 RepID=A0ABS1IMU6_9GAMM|nr:MULTISPECIES: LysR family transcriptional regulator [Limnobaculum]MBK5143068.1 LysR family transcriptional regulator [Limnobaculum allomyrinae]MBV7693398.1 LysR family transcriptional regulator [Limnobaculum sp. M2-1]
MQSKLDLNLARILCEIIDTGSVSAAAESLKSNISTISTGLNKLRKHHNNILLFRQGNGMQPTALALELYNFYRPALNLFDEADKHKGDTSQLAAPPKLRIATIPLLDLLLVDKFLDDPDFCGGSSWDIFSIPQDPTTRIERLRRKQIDIDIGYNLPKDSSLLSYPLNYGNLVMVCKKDHPRINQRITLEQYKQESPLGLISPDEKFGKEIPIFQHADSSILFKQFRSSSIVTVLVQVSTKELIAFIPAVLAPWVCQKFNLRTIEYDFLINETILFYAHIHRSEKHNVMLKKIIAFLSDLE